jgi:hypothetical protein
MTRVRIDRMDYEKEKGITREYILYFTVRHQEICGRAAFLQALVFMW